MAVLIAAPLLTAGAFEQLPWQVDSWSRTVPNLLPPSAPPPESGTSNAAIADAGTPAGDMTLAVIRSSPLAQMTVSTPTASQIPQASTETVAATATATATATASSVSPTPQPSPTTVSTPFDEAVSAEMIVTSSLNVRDAPGLDADVREVLENGTRVIVTGGPLEADGHEWYEVSGDGITGWAAGEFLEPA